jgi:hypothetical protein
MFEKGPEIKCRIEYVINMFIDMKKNIVNVFIGILVWAISKPNEPKRISREAV